MQSNAFKNKLEQFRAHYKNSYGIEMDDETLYFFIRVNEMQIALSKKIDEQPKIKFERGLDYFWYAIGISMRYIFLLLFLCILSVAGYFLFSKFG